MFKRSFLGAALCASLCISVAASAALATQPVALKQLNQQISSILASLQNASTQASLVFKAIRTDDQHALDLSLSGDYKKTGSVTSLELKLARFHYQYGDGTAPAVRFSGFVGIDLTKLFSADQLNQLIPGLQSDLQSTVQQLAQQYGDAIQVTSEINNEKMDGQGNYVSLDAKIHVTMNLDKLPQGVTADSIPLKEAKLTLHADLSKGIAVSGLVFMNPAYSSFQQDQQGLKESMDKLLKQDSDTIQSLTGLYQVLDQFADQIVNGQQPSLSIH